MLTLKKVVSLTVFFRICIASNKNSYLNFFWHWLLTQWRGSKERINWDLIKQRLIILLCLEVKISPQTARLLIGLLPLNLIWGHPVCLGMIIESMSSGPFLVPLHLYSLPLFFLLCLFGHCGALPHSLSSSGPPALCYTQAISHFCVHSLRGIGAWCFFSLSLRFINLFCIIVSKPFTMSSCCAWRKTFYCVFCGCYRLYRRIAALIDWIFYAKLKLNNTF